MSTIPSILWLIPALPLSAACLIALFSKLLRDQSHWLCVLAIAGSCAVSTIVFTNVYAKASQEQAEHEGEHHESPLSVAVYYPWFEVGSLKTDGGEIKVGLSLRADALSSMMVMMITFIGTLIAIFSIGYMHHEGGYPRFFASVSLFIFAMTMLVLGDNFFVLYLGWEGVGLCSYLLIGFWFAKPAAADAARKAFLVTRIGDVGLLLGILTLWVGSGYRIDYEGVFSHLDPSLATVAALLIFAGAAGKSAQFPLHVWLPDAMEGPTPVSALIHAATMVTAGVYLVARCTPLFVLSPTAQLTVACIGGFTAIFAALIALTQTDLKRVLAYSTLSQLGYMFLGLGCAVGDPALASFAVVAALFHLFTHAFFKALLFLGAGSVMHAMGGVIDMRRFGGLRKVMPTTHWTFLCGSLALAGFPLLSGFWSKDEIIAATWAASQKSDFGTIYLILFGVALFTAALTAFYTFRAYFKTFWGEERIPEEAHGHAHESPPVMTIPLMILSVFALGVGLALGPTHLFEGFLSKTPGLSHPGDHGSLALMLVSSLIAVGGIAVAYFMYVKQPEIAPKLALSYPWLYQLSLNKFYVDDLYANYLVAPIMGVVYFCRDFDKYFVDGIVDRIGDLPSKIGMVFRPIQNGLVQFYALAMILGLTVFILALVRAL